MTKSFINTKHGHWGHRTTSDLTARKAGWVTKGIPLIAQPWGERRGAPPHVTLPTMGSINTGQTSPGSHGPELRCSPGPTGWVCCLAWLWASVPARSLQGHEAQQNHGHHRECVNTDFYEGKEKSRQTTAVLKHLVWEQPLTGSLTFRAKRGPNLVHVCHDCRGRGEHELPSSVAALGILRMRRTKACPRGP